MTNTLQSLIPEIENHSTTTQEHVYDRLRYAIMIGAIPPGTSLTIRGLAEIMDLSPTPIREAVKRLSSERAIEILDNRRMTVPEMTLGRFEELIALRVTLETHAAERSLPYISDIMIEKIITLDLEMDEKVSINAFDALTVLNLQFHRALYMINPHQAVMPLIESVWLQLGPFQRCVIQELKNYYVVDRHKEIIAALKSRDPLALTIAIESDIRDGIARSGRTVLQQKLRSDNSR